MGTLGAVLALADLHENASGSEKEDYKCTNDNAGNGSCGEGGRSIGAVERSIGVDGFNGVLGKDGLIKAEKSPRSWLLVTACREGNENCMFHQSQLRT